MKSIMYKNGALKIFLFIFIIFSGSCEKNNGAPFTPDFSFSIKEGNIVEFKNLSEGEYHRLTWTFGNGISDSNTDKTKVFEIYYPQAGDYEVTLKLADYEGNSETVKKTISISNTDLQPSFTLTVAPDNANKYNLVNTTEGTYDSFCWKYRTKTIENQLQHIAYFPFAGTYTVELQVTKLNNTFSETKTVTILQDDANYLENLTLAWSDEFDNETINLQNWTFETGASGWGNNELQNYTNGENAQIVDGKLIITARKVNENTSVGSYTSSRMVSKEKKEFQYGKIEISAKLPAGRGIWPALWMLGGNIDSAGWPACGEIDIMEYVGFDPNMVHATVHTPVGYGANGNGNGMLLETCEEEFHIYGLLWTEKKMQFYIDEPQNVIHTYQPASQTNANYPFHQPFFFILNVAVGGNWGGAQGIDNSIFPQSLEIDYVRVYQE